MGPLRSIKVRGLRGLGRMDVKLDGSSLIVVGPSGSGKSTLLAGIADELAAELDGRPHPALDLQATGGADQQLRIAFVSRPVQLRWEQDLARQWREGEAVVLHLDDERSGAFETGAFDASPRPAGARLAGQLERALVDRHEREQAAQDAMEAEVHAAWLLDKQQMLRTVLDAPRLRLAFRAGTCALDLGDGRRPRLRELARGHRTAIALYAELILRVEAARLRSLRPTLDPPGLAIVDMIERDLDPRLQSRLLTQLRERFPNVQWIVSTHSPLVATGLEGATVLDVGRHELRRTGTLRREGLEVVAARMRGEEPSARPSAPPPARLPPKAVAPPVSVADTVAASAAGVPARRPPARGARAAPAKAAPSARPRRSRHSTKEGVPFSDD